MISRSFIYVGAVMHRRLRPRPHHFRYRCFWLLIDLDELERLDRRLRFFSYNRLNLFCLYDRDHCDGSAKALRNQAMDLMRQACVDPEGCRISLLCMPRTAGYDFNPLSVFFCHRADGELSAVVYQVHNTFGERHNYVFAVPAGGALSHEIRKEFFVSPFLEMDLRYRFRLKAPDARMSIAIAVHDELHAVLQAVATGERRPLTDAALISIFLQIPVVTLKVMAAIHWEAFRLWSKRIRLLRRPAPPARSSAVVRAAASDSERAHDVA